MNKLKDNLDTVTQPYDICVLGSEGCGKTSLILNYLHGGFIETSDSNVEELFTKVIRNDGNYTEITILDTTCRDNYSTSRKMQLLNNSGLILTYSINDETSFQAMMETHERILDLRTDLPLITIVGLKCDLENERVVEYVDGEMFAKKINALSFIEVSAKMSIRIKDCFKPLVDSIIETKANQKKHSSSFKQYDMSSSLQSLKEVLSTPTPTPDLPNFPSTPITNYNTSSPVPTANTLDLNDINIEIPKFKSNSFAAPASNEPKIELGLDHVNESFETCNSQPKSLDAKLAISNSTILREKSDSKLDEASNRQIPSVSRSKRSINTKEKSESGCCIIV